MMTVGLLFVVACSHGYLLPFVDGWVMPSSHNLQLHETKVMLSGLDNINDDDDDDDDGPSREEVIELQTHTKRKPPSETLVDLSTSCKELGVDTFDIYGDFDSDKQSSYLRQFEAEVAEYFGKEDALFCLSGGMAQSIMLAINARNHTSKSGGGYGSSVFACHPTSHLLLHENDAYNELLNNMEAVIIGDQANMYNPETLKDIGCYSMEPIRLSDVKDMLSSPSETTTSYPNQLPINCAEELSTLMIELPHREIGGKLTPWNEVEEIATICKENGINFHCDGARLVEASAGYGHESVKETAKPFTSVYISFYKGLGALSGAMLLGDSDFIAEARIWLRRFGGNLYTVLPYAISSWTGFRNFSQSKENVFEYRRDKLARVLKLLSTDARISSIVQFDPKTPEVNMVHGYLRMSYDECMKALDKVEDITGIRVLSRVRSCKDNETANSNQFGCRFEWTMGEANTLIDDELFLLGWKTFAQEVEKIEK